MANKNNVPGGQKSRNTSQSGGTLTQRLAFDDEYQSFRQHDINCPVHNRFEAVYDANDNLSKITYYFALEREVSKIETVADSSGSLNNTYFTVYSAYDKIGFYFWFNVDGGGTDPALSGLTGIEVGINSDDSANIVALAIKMASQTNTEFNYLFTLEQNQNNVTFDRKQLGTVTLDSAGTSGFNLTTIIEGAERIEAIYCMEYDAGGCLIDTYKL